MTLAELLASRLPAVGANGTTTQLVLCTVTATNPLTVTLAGSTVPVPGVSKASGYTPAIGDTVFCAHIDGAALHVLHAVA